jgi:hypothetical protein
LPRREIWIVVKPSRSSCFIVAPHQFWIFPTNGAYGDRDQRLN